MPLAFPPFSNMFSTFYHYQNVINSNSPPHFRITTTMCHSLPTKPNPTFMPNMLMPTRQCTAATTMSPPLHQFPPPCMYNHFHVPSLNKQCTSHCYHHIRNMQVKRYLATITPETVMARMLPNRSVYTTSSEHAHTICLPNTAMQACQHIPMLLLPQHCYIAYQCPTTLLVVDPATCLYHNMAYCIMSTSCGCNQFSARNTYIDGHRHSLAVQTH
jgi:hypothetical protein